MFITISLSYYSSLPVLFHHIIILYFYRNPALVCTHCLFNNQFLWKVRSWDSNFKNKAIKLKQQLSFLNYQIVQSSRFCLQWSEDSYFPSGRIMMSKKGKQDLWDWPVAGSLLHLSLSPSSSSLSKPSKNMRYNLLRYKSTQLLIYIETLLGAV